MRLGIERRTFYGSVCLGFEWGRRWGIGLGLCLPLILLFSFIESRSSN